jgi:hypothetical protein
MNIQISTIRNLKLVIYLVLVFVIAPLYVYVNLPVISPWFIGLPLEVFFLSMVVVGLEVQVIKGQKKGAFITALLIMIISLIYIGVMSIAGMPMFRADKYHQLLGEVKEGKSFSEDVTPVAADKIRIVDKEVARRLGDKVLGEEPALGSQVYIGDFHIQKVKEDLFWVAPLEHSGFFKWLNNPNGTHGYIMVSATNERDVKLVREINGKPVKIKYQMEGWFSDYLPRHIYMKGYYNLGLTDYTFEIDDEGNPYWVVTLYKHEIGFSGNNAYAIVVVNASTGAVKKYTAKDAPTWIDRMQPKDIIESQINNWGEYVHGYWNFSNKDKLQASEGMSLVYGNDNRSYWYTGITSVGGDESTIGFMLVDTRTKEAKLYRQPGATENAAMQSAQGKVQEKGYTSSFPIMYNINGIATYVMSLKDQAGLIKMIAMVSVQDYSIVGVGDNLRDALRAYKDAYSNSGNAPVVHSKKAANQLRAKVKRISVDVSGGNSNYFILLENLEDKIYIGSSSISKKLPLTNAGDSVLLEFEPSSSSEIEIYGFDNLLFKATDKIEKEGK